METKENKKLLILYTLKILKDFSDSNHILTQKQIIDLIKKNYGMSCERKAISNNVEMLKKFGYEINNQSSKGCYLETREFEDCELRFIIDTILYSQQLKPKYIYDLIDKCLQNGSITFRENFKQYKDNIGFHKDIPQFFINIEIIDEAIIKGKPIVFNFNQYSLDKKLKPISEQLICMPCRMIFSKGLYSLMGAIKIQDHYEVVFYDIDKMTNVAIRENISVSNVVKKQILTEVESYIENSPNIASDKLVETKMKVLETFVPKIYDKFGLDTKVKETNEKYVNLKIYEVSFKAHYGDILDYALMNSKQVEIIFPQSLREKIKEISAILKEKYEN